MKNRTRDIIGRVFAREVKTPVGRWKESLDTEPHTIKNSLKYNKC